MRDRDGDSKPSQQMALVWLKEGQARPNCLALLGLELPYRENQTLSFRPYLFLC